MAEPDTVEAWARVYVDTLNLAPDGWGTHKHPVYGSSARIMWRMWQLYTADIADAAISAEFERRRGHD